MNKYTRDTHLYVTEDDFQFIKKHWVLDVRIAPISDVLHRLNPTVQDRLAAIIVFAVARSRRDCDLSASIGAQEDAVFNRPMCNPRSMGFLVANAKAASEGHHDFPLVEKSSFCL